MDQEVHRSILKAHWDVDDNSDTKSPWLGQGFLIMQRRVQGRFRQSIYARCSSDHLHVKEIKKAWGEVHNAFHQLVWGGFSHENQFS